MKGLKAEGSKVNAGAMLRVVLVTDIAILHRRPSKIVI